MANYYDEVDAAGTVKRCVAPFQLRYLTRGELELLIPAAGLALEALYGSYDLEPFQEGSPRLIAVAVRPGARTARAPARRADVTAASRRPSARAPHPGDVLRGRYTGVMVVGGRA